MPPKKKKAAEKKPAAPKIADEQRRKATEAEDSKKDKKALAQAKEARGIDDPETAEGAPESVKKAVDDIQRSQEARKAEADDDESRIRAAVAKDLSVDADDLEIEEDDLYGVSGYRVKGAGREDLFVFLSDDDAERAALNNVRQMLEDEPELFNQDWLRGHYSFTPTDIGVFANEEADNYVENLSDDDAVDEAGMRDDYDAVEAWNLADEDEREQLEEPDYASTEDVVEAAREKVQEDRYEAIAKELETDPFGYWADTLGLGDDEAVAIMQKHGVIDIDAAAEEAVSTDGVGHFLSSYDGDLHELSNGMPYIKE